MGPTKALGAEVSLAHGSGLDEPFGPSQNNTSHFPALTAPFRAAEPTRLLIQRRVESRRWKRARRTFLSPAEFQPKHYRS